MNTTRTLGLFLYSCLFTANIAWAGLSGSSSTRISLGATQKLLSSPPLPTLDAGGQLSVTPAVGYIGASSEGSYVEPASDPNNTNPTSGYTANYTGKLSGVSAGLSLTSKTYGRFGFFMFFVGSNMTGGVQAYDGATLVAEYKDLKALGIGAVGGVSYRFWGESNSKFAAGAFAGPGYLYLNSASQSEFYIPSGYSPKIVVNINAVTAYTGLQGYWRLNKLLINPYVLYMKEISKTCTYNQVGLGNSSEVPCDTNYNIESNRLDPDTSFSGFGLFLGYGDLRLNVFSKANFSEGMRDFEYTNYTLSYTFGLK